MTAFDFAVLRTHIVNYASNLPSGVSGSCSMRLDKF